MEELQTTNDSLALPSDDLLIYNKLADTIRVNGTRGLKSREEMKKLNMTAAQLAYCVSYWSSNGEGPASGARIMLMDDLCKLMSRSPEAVFLDEICFDDEYIAETFAKVMHRQKHRGDSYTHSVTAADIFSLAARSTRASLPNALPLSELSLFSGRDDETASLRAAAARHTPVYTENGICVAERDVPCRAVKRDSVAVIYCTGESQAERLRDFLTGTYAKTAEVEISLCPTDLLLASLVTSLDEIHISTGKLPKPTLGRYASAYAGYSDLPYLELANAFLTDGVFGPIVLTVNGDKRAVASVCRCARRKKLSVFEDIKLKQKKKKAIAINNLSFSSRLLTPLMTSVSASPLRTAIPRHDPSLLRGSDVIPTASQIFERTKRGITDRVFAASVDLKSSPLPFHSGVYALVAPLIAAAKSGINLKNGELSLSIKASLCFDKDSSACSMAALLGLYRAETELPIPSDTDLHLEVNSSGVCTVTVSLLSSSRVTAELELSAPTVSDFLIGHADRNALPDFEMLRKLISGEDN